MYKQTLFNYMGILKNLGIRLIRFVLAVVALAIMLVGVCIVIPIFIITVPLIALLAPIECFDTKKMIMDEPTNMICD